MPLSASSEELATALVDYAERDAYPTSENVASAELPSSALPAVLEGINKGRETVKAELRELSKGSVHLDNWIAQAKQLQKDVEESKAEERKISEGANTAKNLRAHVTDASAKVDLLKKELDFNQNLIGALEQLQIATGLLDKAREAEEENELVQAVRELANARRVVGELDDLQSSRFGGLLSRRAALVREGLVAKVVKDWALLIASNQERRTITIHKETDKGGVVISLDDTVTAMVELGILETYISRFYRDLDNLIVSPRFSPAPDGATTEIHFDESEVSTAGRIEGHDLVTLAKDVKALVDYLFNHLPQEAAKLLFDKLLPNLLTQIVNEQLDPSIPVSVDELVEYAPSMDQIQDLATFSENTGIDIPSDGDLSEWIQRLPVNWLSRRREAALNTLRAVCYKAVQVTKTAERVETQMISSDDVMATTDQAEDDAWNEDWGDEDETATAGQPASMDEDEDASAWGLDDNETKSPLPKKPNIGDAEPKDEDEGDAWGWGDDDGNDDNSEPKDSGAMQTTPSKPVPKNVAGTNGSAVKERPITQKEMTLRETFAITAVPDTLLDLVNAVLSDAEKISQPAFPIDEIRSAAPALAPIPTLLLALYRATARSFYEKRAVGDILIYNDSQDLCTRLEQLLADLDSNHPLARRLPRALETEIKSLQSFSRLAYGREMDSQRTILTDLLSGTSGFTGCTNANNAREYRSAIQDVVGHIRQVGASWDGVLSDSALKQSLGALVSHVLVKLVSDILEQASEPAGISEEESKQLKSFLDQVAELSELFNVQSPDGEIRSLVHVYTPAWLRFNYLGEILEASLADIKFLWKEAGLSVEFEADEVVDLIEALFAESEYRREAIREIRRSTRG